MRGSMLWFNEEKEYGFIEAEDGERVYVHRNGFVEGAAPVGRCAGRAVDFERVTNELGVSATGVSFVDDLNGPRARPRRNQNSVRT